MERLAYEATDKTPLIRLDPSAGVFEVRGVSIHEHASRFYEEVLDAVERYSASPAARTRISVHIHYFNSSSAKCLLDILKRFEDLHASGASQVAVEWTFAKGDLDMEEAAMDYKELLDLPFTLREE
ncbi:MAG: DUF1987 domain-containing protein [Flavobacteriales bacterium]|nr:DUF1987 domain-containing protein [Flavobacteriales bacterium]